MNKEVMILVGAGQIGMAIARRMGFGKKIVVGDKNINNAKNIAEIMNNAGLMWSIWKWIYPQENLLNLL